MGKFLKIKNIFCSLISYDKERISFNHKIWHGKKKIFQKKQEIMIFSPYHFSSWKTMSIEIILSWVFK
jgi:hypothetical protein